MIIGNYSGTEIRLFFTTAFSYNFNYHVSYLRKPPIITLAILISFSELVFLFLFLYDVLSLQSFPIKQRSVCIHDSIANFVIVICD